MYVQSDKDGLKIVIEDTNTLAIQLVQSILGSMRVAYVKIGTPKEITFKVEKADQQKVEETMRKWFECTSDLHHALDYTIRVGP